LDVTNAAEMKAFIEEVDNKYPLTLVVANAGIGDGGRKDIETAYEVMNVNVVGLMNTLRPVIEPMKARGKGQIAIVSSVASFFEMKGMNQLFFKSFYFLFLKRDQCC
jgi:NADP-dependent 3-hydroxy acid dehydrogenase YdfG